MDLKKRKEYFIFTSIFWGIGFILYGGMAAAGKELLDIPLNTFLVFCYMVWEEAKGEEDTESGNYINYNNSIVHWIIY